MLYTSLSRDQVLSDIPGAIVRVEPTFNILSAHKLNDETVACRLLSTMICYLHLYDGTGCNESDVPHTVQVTKPQSFHFFKNWTQRKSAQCDNDSSN